MVFLDALAHLQQFYALTSYPRVLETHVKKKERDYKRCSLFPTADISSKSLEVKTFFINDLQQPTSVSMVISIKAKKPLSTGVPSNNGRKWTCWQKIGLTLHNSNYAA